MINRERLDELLAGGEGVSVEFKTCAFELPRDVFDSVCGFLNRDGGHLFLGVDNDGNVLGVIEGSTQQVKDAFVSNCNNPQKLFPTYYLKVDEIAYGEHTLLYIYVPPSSVVHYTNGKIFDRNEDGDFDISGNQELISNLYLRKQNSYSENKIYPALQLSDFREDLFVRARKLAKNRRADHPWLEMDNMELMRYSGLYLKDYNTGQEGFTLGAVLLLGRDEVIRSILPHYRTDALLRVKDTDRHDDRDDVRTNLIEAYDRLMAFIDKWLPDKFHQDEQGNSIDLRNRIFREVVANMLVHREYINAFPAKLVITKDGVETENWSKAHGNGAIDPINFSPFPKNPNITKFFKEIGRVDELGSGVRNVHKFCALYTPGKSPQFIEGDVFRIVVPADVKVEGVSDGTEGVTAESEGVSGKHEGVTAESEVANEGTLKGAVEGTINELTGIYEPTKKKLKQLLLLIIKEEGKRIPEYAAATNDSEKNVERYVAKLKEEKLIDFIGAPKDGRYVITEALKKKLNK